MKEKLQKIWAHKKIVNFAILFLLLFGACFSKWFALVLTIYVAVVAIFFSFQDNLEVVLLLIPFGAILPYYETQIIFTVLGVKYLIEVIRKKKKLNLITLIPILVMILYVALPIHETSLVQITLFTFFLGVIYLTFEYREELKFVNLIRFFCLGIIISCCFYYLQSVSPYLDSLVFHGAEFSFIKMAGLTVHCNYLRYYCVLAIGGALICKLNRKMSIIEFLIFFVPTFVFGYLTISRNFIICVAIEILLFSLFYIIKYKSKSWKFLLSFFIAIIAVIGICITPTKMYLVRFNIAPIDIIQEYEEEHKDIQDAWDIENNKGSNTEYEFGSEEWKEGLLNGEFKYDPGRDIIRQEYWENYTSSTKTIFFGRGIAAPEIGQMSAHNKFIQLLWMHGICGTFILLYILGAFIYCVGFKKLFNYCQLSLILLPYLATMFSESFTNDYFQYIIIVSCLSFIDKMKEIPQKRRVVYYNSSLSKGGTDMYMLNLITNADRNKFDFDVIIRTKECSDDFLKQKFNNLNVPVKFLGNNLFIQIINAIKVLHNNHYDIMHINATSEAVGLFAYLGKDFGGIENVIFHSHMGGNDNKKGVEDLLGCFLAKNFADNLVACSDVAAEFMYGKKYCKKHKIKVLNNAVDMNKFQYNTDVRKNYRKRLNIENKFVILHVGRFVEQKNHAKLLKVFKSIVEIDKNSVLVLVGSGVLQDTIVSYVKANHLEGNVIFLNERTDVNNIMQAADVFVMTSLHEGLPIVAVEAQASGLPLILSGTITRTANITGNCAFVDLNADDEIWAAEILKKKQFVRQDTAKIMAIKGFELESASKEIEQLYQSGIKKEKK